MEELLKRLGLEGTLGAHSVMNIVVGLGFLVVGLVVARLASAATGRFLRSRVEAALGPSFIDGDGTRVEGADCDLDPRFADGISATFTYSAVGADVIGVASP